MAKFLSDEWFDKLEELREEAGDLELPTVMKSVVVNIIVTTSEGDVEMCINAGQLEKGHKADAPTKMILPMDLAKRMLIDNDRAAGQQAMLNGKIKVEGNMGKIITMGSAQPSDKQLELREKVVAMTEV